MFIKQRRPRRSAKFQSRWSQATTRRREYMASLYATILIQTFLFVFLLVLVVRTAALMHEKFTDVPAVFRYTVPLFIAAVAALVARGVARNARRVIVHFRGRPNSSKF